MELPDFIQIGNQAPPLRFLIIGGWAVGAHGNPRATFDVDFMIRRADRDGWFERAMACGMKLFRESGAFAQFTQAGDAFDLMLVADQTFGKMWDASEARAFGEMKARVPCLDHLLALKLHALRQNLAHRTSKDADDVEVLLRRHEINLGDSHYKTLFLKYATANSMKPSSESSVSRDAGRPSLEFELPNPEGFTSLPTWVSLERMLKGIRQMRAWFPAGIPTPEERWQAKTTQEFKL